MTLEREAELRKGLAALSNEPLSAAEATLVEVAGELLDEVGPTRQAKEVAALMQKDRDARAAEGR